MQCVIIYESHQGLQMKSYRELKIEAQSETQPLILCKNTSENQNH